MQHNITVDNRKIIIDTTDNVVRNNVNVDTIKVTFKGDIWDDVDHTSVFFKNGDVVIRQEYVDGMPIPWEVLERIGVLRLTFKGYTEDENEIIVTQYMKNGFTVEPCGHCHGGNVSRDPSPSEFKVFNDTIEQIRDEIEAGMVKGEPGADGYTPIKGIDYFDGQDGYTPIKGVDYFDGLPGNDGEPGYTPVKGIDYFDGADGQTPVITATKVGNETIILSDGVEIAHVLDGEDGAPGSDATATDVQINGTSITEDGVANIPLANQTVYGVVKADPTYGIGQNQVGLYVAAATQSQINSRNNGNKPIAPSVLDYAVKAAMTDGKGAEWTGTEKESGRNRMGAASNIELEKIRKRVQLNEQRIQIAEAVLSEGDFGWKLETEESYEHEVPKNAVKVVGKSNSFADLVGIEGKTVVWNNQHVYGRTGEVLGITFSTVEAGKKWHVSGTATSTTSYTAISVYEFIVGNVYFIDSRTPLPVKSNTGVKGNGSIIVTARTSLSCGFEFTAGTQYEFDYEPFVVDLTQMFGAGNEPTELTDPRIQAIKAYVELHPEFNAGELISANVERVESVGKNLFIHKAGQYNLVYGGRDLDAETIDDLFTLENGVTYTFSCVNTIDAMLYVRTKRNGVWSSVTSGKNNVTFTVPIDAERMNIWWYKSGAGQADYATITNVQIERGTTATEYSPYGIKESIDIPQLDLKSAGAVADREDFVAEQVERKIGVVDLGSLNWRKHPNGFFLSDNLSPISASWWGISSMPNVVCGKFARMTWNEITESANDNCVSAFENQVRVSCSTYANATEFKSAMHGVLLYYELAEPLTEPLEMDKSFMECEPGGVIRFAQANGEQMAVPHAIQFPVNNREGLTNG